VHIFLIACSPKNLCGIAQTLDTGYVTICSTERMKDLSHVSWPNMGGQGHYTLPTPFTDELLENVGCQEAYSFIDGFSSSHQIKIATEDMYKTNFAT
jgi:hypothetical protein